MNNLLTAALLLLLCACSVGPDYIRPETPLQKQWHVDYQAAADLANTVWWQQFGDPALDSLIKTAVNGNLDLKVATARLDQYLGLLDTTRSQYFPQISAAYTGGQQRQAGVTVESHQVALNATWELDIWGRLRRSDEAVKARIVGTEAGRRGVLMTVVANVASSYLTLRGLDRQLEIVRATEKAYAESLNLFRLRFKYGTVSQLEVSQSESEYEAARQSIPTCEALIRQQENLLSLLLGRSPEPVLRGKPLDEMHVPVIPSGLPSELLERRPDVIQSEQALIAANAEVGVAKAAYFPRISLTGALGVASSDIDKLVALGSGIWSAAGQVATPLLNFGAISGQVKQAEALKQQAVYQYQQTILNGFREVEDSLIKTTKGQEQLEAQKRQIQALEEYARISRLQFEAGSSNYLQVLDADRSLFNGRLALNRTKFELLTTFVSVYKAMGGGWVTKADRLSLATDEKQ